MRLWTWQQPDFSLIGGRVIHEHSEYAKTVEGLREAYDQLFERVGTDQIIWCYARPNEYIKLPGDTKVEWILDVPDDEVVLIDSFVWNRIIGTKNFVVPKSLRRQWRDQAIAKFPDDQDARRQFEEELRQAYYAEEPPPGGWWTKIFIDDPATDCASTLVRHPVPREWVVSDGRPGARS